MFSNATKHLDFFLFSCIISECVNTQAEIAQLVEHFTRNEGVVGSSPIFSFFFVDFSRNSIYNKSCKKDAIVKAVSPLKNK